MARMQRFLISTALTLATSLPLSAQDVSSDTVVARVGDTEITIGHMIAQVQVLPPEQLQQPIDAIFVQILDRLTQQEALAQLQDAPSKRVLLQLENERRSLLASETINEVGTRVNVTEEMLLSAYDQRFENFTPDTEFNASHILVETQEEALEIIEMLNGGADFAETAMEKSTGPSGPGGGQLGWFGSGRMVPAFENAVKQLEVGSISDPVETQYGWHVIKLNESRIPTVPTFDELRAQLESETFNLEYRRLLTELIDEAGIEIEDLSMIDPNILGDASLLEN